METRDARLRLSTMMFGQYFIIGAWSVTLATYLMAAPSRGGLHFPPGYTGWIYSTIAIAGLLSPLFTGFLADRLFAAQKLLGIFHLLSAALLGGAAWWCDRRQPLICECCLSGDGDIALAIDDTFSPLFILMLLYAFCCLSTTTLTNVVGMRNLRDPQRSFGSIRLYGTIGWIVAGLCVELAMRPISASPIWLAAGSSAVVGVFCFTLPHTPPKHVGGGIRQSLGLPALKLFENGAFLVLIVCTLAIAVAQQFYTVYANRYLTELGAPYPTAVQTIAQVTEVASMALFAIALPRLGIKAALAIGLIGMIVRNAAFASESVGSVVAIGLPLHGFSYAFFYVVGAMFVDRLAPTHLRASTQGIITFVSAGVGPLLGNYFSGIAVEHQTSPVGVAWANVWFIPTAIAAVTTAAFLLFFRGADRPTPIAR